MDNKKTVQLDPARLYGFKVFGQATLPQAKIGAPKKTSCKAGQLDPSRLYGFKVSGQATLPQAKIGVKRTSCKTRQTK